MKSDNLKQKKFTVAVVGATGVVGQEMTKLLEQRNFPLQSIRFFASAKSAGKKIVFKGKKYPVEPLEESRINGIDIAVFSAGASVSKEFAPVFAGAGAYVIDNSSAWRMDKDIPLVVPEVNPEQLTRTAKIIANPNCSTIQMVVVLKPIYDEVGIDTIHVATYQAVSGAGKLGIEDLESQSRAWAQRKTIPKSKKIPHQIAFNLVPQIDVFVDGDYTKEEMKMVNETRKILGSDLIKLSATCVRVPVFRSHSEALWIKTKQVISPERVKALLSKAPGVEVIDSPKDGKYPMPLSASHMSKTFVGRIRQDLTDKNGLLMWIVSDNLLKGAALNAIEIAEELVKKQLVG